MSTMLTEKDREDLLEHWKMVRKKKLIKWAILGVCVLVVTATVWGAGFKCAKNRSEQEIEQLNARIQEMMDTPVVLESITPEIVQKTLSDKMSDISELASAEYIFTNADRFTDSRHIKNWKVPLTQKGFVQRWDGIIKAGIDMSEVDVIVEEKTITITLPPAKILSYEVDYDSVEILDEKNNLFNPISVEDTVKFDQSSQEAMETRAIEKGLLVKAQTSAERIIAELLTAAIPDADAYVIEFAIAEK